jgi:hypothetical protein
VTLDQAKVTKVKFPSVPDKEAELTALLEKKLPGATKTISLDRLETELEADEVAQKGVDVKNDPPKIIITGKPSLQVLIDGAPQRGRCPAPSCKTSSTRNRCSYSTGTNNFTICGWKTGGCRPRR